MQVRIAKFIASCGVCSRRNAEALVRSGRVIVDDKLVTTPSIKVSNKNIIKIDDQILTPVTKTRVWAYYKPVGLITTHKDPKNRPTVFASLQELPRVISVGRLDVNSEGLLLLTNSGEFARHMELPANKYLRVYKVRAFGQSDKLPIGENLHININSVSYKVKLIEKINDSKAKNKWYRITLTEGKNREVRKIFRYFGLAVNRLIRIQYGPYHLGKLKPGEYKEVECNI